MLKDLNKRMVEVGNGREVLDALEELKDTELWYCCSI